MSKEIVDDVLNSLWVERYRPKKISDMVLSEQYSKIFNDYIKNKNIPNLMFAGSPGSGKTTLARILINEIVNDYSDVLELNGSGSSGVDVVRNNIQDFLETVSFSDSKIKIVYIDEADYLSKDAQAALRHIIEKFSSNGRFIFTLNHPSKISDALHSRFQTFTFNKIPKEFVNNFVIGILDKENIEYDINGVNRVVNNFYPDVRKIINTLQTKIENGKLSSNLSDVDSTERKIHSIILDILKCLSTSDVKNYVIKLKMISKIINENDVDYIEIYKILGEDDNIPFWAKIIIGDSADSMVGCMIPQLHFMTCIHKISKASSAYKELLKN